MLQFKSQPIHLLLTFLKLAPVVTGYLLESQTLTIKFKGFTEGDMPTACLRVIIEQRAEYRPASGIPEIYAASLTLESELPLLKRILCIPLWCGVLLTGLSTLVLLAFQQYGVRKLEFLIAFLVFTIATCFLVEVGYAKPNSSEVLHGLFVPQLKGNGATGLAISLLGAMVMPNNEEYMKEVSQKKRNAPAEKAGETSNKKRETPKTRGKEPEQDKPEKCQRCGGRHSDDKCRWNTGACFGCGKQGHLVKDCPERMGQARVYQLINNCPAPNKKV
ncbi:hypothetical protein F0562_001300 [Nyssa sinensis]|uniref:CCHC-type domain-containing protein n=1 Tax=Nyssa sinensis TaxID=561372 RepID=A0A5J5C6T1_9ASTE|nr:hypothetical protein F0562_001300 [Nyssa sinensis]